MYKGTRLSGGTMDERRKILGGTSPSTGPKGRREEGGQSALAEHAANNENWRKIDI